VKKLALVLIAFVVSASVAGCTVSQASDRDQYGNYLSELNSGNTYFGQARTQYDAARSAFPGGFNYDAINAMTAAADNYAQAASHYGLMIGNAGGQDQSAYASALKSYAESCKFAASAYAESYKAYDAGDPKKGEARMDAAAAFVAQANGGYVRRRVTLGGRAGEQYEILAGLSTGEKVVADGALFIQFAENQ
jgi:hypothetical protein